MSFLISVLTGFKYLERRSDDDLIDKLHYSLTTNILIGLSILVSWKQFGGKPLECMVPDQFTQSWEQFVENYCWAQDTYYVPLNEELGLDHKVHIEEGRISYYQWVPFLLILSAMTFQIPFLLWRFLSGRSGIKISNIISHASDPKNVMPDIRPSTIRMLSVHLENALQFQKRLYKKHVVPHKILRFLNFPYTTCYVTIIYLIVKSLYLANVVLNFIIMNYFLNNNRQSKDLYGWRALHEILNGTEWHRSGFFPRVTVCDFKVRGMGSDQDHSIQCVLVINIFTEKIFIFLWFWYHVLMVASVFSFLYWTTISVLPCFGTGFITRNLELADMPFDPKESANDVQRFVGGYLKADGVFVLRMVSMHTGVIFTSEIIAAMWKSYFQVENQVARNVINKWPHALHSLSQPAPKSGHSPLDQPDMVLRHRTTAPADMVTSTDESGYKSDTEQSKLIMQQNRQHYMFPQQKQATPQPPPLPTTSEEVSKPTNSKREKWFLEKGTNSDESLKYYSENTSLPGAYRHDSVTAESPYSKFPPYKV